MSRFSRPSMRKYSWRRARSANAFAVKTMKTSWVKPPVRPEKARASVRAEGNETVYSLEYEAVPRKLAIRFESAFPHRIRSWEETGPGGFAGSPTLTTKATATKSLMLDYWNKHGNADAHYRRELGVTAW